MPLVSAAKADMPTPRRKAAAAVLLSGLARARRIERALRRYLMDLFEELLNGARRLAFRYSSPVTLRQALRALVEQFRPRVTLAIYEAGEAEAEQGHSRTLKELRKLGEKVEDRKMSDDRRRELLRDLDEEISRSLDPLPERWIRDIELMRSKKTLRPLANRLASRLARESSTYAQVQGELAANQEQGTGYWQWRTVGDHKVRRTHRRANGQVRRIGSLFTTLCRWPRDPLGPISETANCRCHTKPVKAPT